MAAHVAAHITADRVHAPALRSYISQHGRHQFSRQAAALQGWRYFGVGDVQGGADAAVLQQAFAARCLGNVAGSFGLVLNHQARVGQGVFAAGPAHGAQARIVNLPRAED
jgi:hypothetical protein